MRQPIIAGNWKMHKGPTEARKLALGIRNGLLGSRTSCAVVLCPPFVSLEAVREIVHGTPIGLGAQNVFWEPQGAWTGEVSAAMLRDAGCTQVIVGHSERRQHFGESDATVQRRVRAALAAGLGVIVCVGETLGERDAGATLEVVERQVRAGLGDLAGADWARVVLAYEPVWAIGTGRNATPEQAQEVHRAIRDLVATLAGPAVASAVRIQYGGSVKPENAAALLGQPDVDGALVGGASLEAVSFLGIVAAADMRAGG
jgi:triosephosphate isomerase